jgi:hypothetical protein
MDPAIHRKNSGMKWNVEYGPDAKEVLLKLPDDIALMVLDEIDGKLAEDPQALGRRSYFPYQTTGLLHQFWCDKPDQHYFITVFFEFAADHTILVFALAALKP